MERLLRERPRCPLPVRLVERVAVGAVAALVREQAGLDPLVDPDERGRVPGGAAHVGERERRRLVRVGGRAEERRHLRRHVGGQAGDAEQPRVVGRAGRAGRRDAYARLGRRHRRGHLTSGWRRRAGRRRHPTTRLTRSLPAATGCGRLGGRLCGRVGVHPRLDRRVQAQPLLPLSSSRGRRRSEAERDPQVVRLGVELPAPRDAASLDRVLGRALTRRCRPRRPSARSRIRCRRRRGRGGRCGRLARDRLHHLDGSRVAERPPVPDPGAELEVAVEERDHASGALCRREWHVCHHRRVLGRGGDQDRHQVLASARPVPVGAPGAPGTRGESGGPAPGDG